MSDINDWGPEPAADGPPAEPDGARNESHARQPTGNPTVDSVLDSLARLEGTPVSEHVAVFESAHESLRAALADAGTDDQTP